MMTPEPALCVGCSSTKPKGSRICRDPSAEMLTTLGITRSATSANSGNGPPGTADRGGAGAGVCAAGVANCAVAGSAGPMRPVTTMPAKKLATTRAAGRSRRRMRLAHLDTTASGLGGLRQRDGQDAVLEVGLDGVHGERA